MDTKSPITRALPVDAVAFPILAAISFSHLLNDLIQSLIPAIYPLLKETYRLDFGQIGIITLTFQCTASLFQPLVRIFHRQATARPFSLVIGMGFTLTGLLNYCHRRIPTPFSCWPLGLSGWAPLSFILNPPGWLGWPPEAGTGSPNRSSRSAAMRAPRSVPCSRPSWWCPSDSRASRGFHSWRLLAMVVLYRVGLWYRAHLVVLRCALAAGPTETRFAPHTPDRSGVDLHSDAADLLQEFLHSEHHELLHFLPHRAIPAVGAGRRNSTCSCSCSQLRPARLLGGPIGDRFGRKYVMWFSILGVLPFTLMLPYANLFLNQRAERHHRHDSWPRHSPPFSSTRSPNSCRDAWGSSQGCSSDSPFGMGGLGAALLGQLADVTSITTVYRVCSFLPAIGLLTFFLPHERPRGR